VNFAYYTIKSTWSEWFQEIQDAVISGSEIAWEAREKIEKKIGKKVVKNVLWMKNTRIWLDEK
jgi:hypothetical protein